VVGETPIQELRRLSASLNGVNIFVKRDDLTGLAFGGNKVRQMEFFLGEAVNHHADVLVAGGSYAQSNHARVAAAAARAAGLDSVILQRPTRGPLGAHTTGNGLLTRLLAGEVREMHELALAPRGDRLRELEGRRQAFSAVADEFRHAGRRPYVLYGSSAPLGVMGYLSATLELAEQLRNLDVEFSKIFVTSLGVTHAGLHLGAALARAPYQVIGIGYQPDSSGAQGWIQSLIDGALDVLGIEAPQMPEIINDGRFGGPKYGVPSAEGSRAMAMAAQAEGLLLDPIYTSKGFAGLLQWISEGRIGRGESVLFIHTGGLPALFAQLGDPDER
jgi:1-aminocyclopropane-1-carboxylate deaminase/D-cysteine desulfhydrase-like pyridoxal-dependent ACC family enzyme